MSFDALAWAAKQKPGNLAAKMVLLALANYAGETGLAYPSTAAIAAFGDMNAKTATVALDRLEELGLISDTGKRAGSTKQIKVYRLNLESLPKQEASQNRKASENGDESHPKTGDGTSKGTNQKKTSSRALPENWRPEPFGERSKSQIVVNGWSTDEYETQIEHFRAHHKANGSKFTDWQDAWSTWVLNSRRFGAPKSVKPVKDLPPPPTDAQRIEALEGAISLYRRMGRDTECPPLRRELAALKAKVESQAA